MVDLKGSLGGIGLPAIIQLIGELHHSGSLELSKGPISGVLGFDDGRLVSASRGADEGLAGLSGCVLDLADADFRFVEGNPAGERPLDLGGTDLQRLLVRIASGESLEAAAPAMLVAQSDDSREPDVCPRLGFADDPLRHYSRSTALHRCFATVAPSLVTAQEQRDLCLSGRYPTCPRFRNASRQRRTAPAAATAAPPVESGVAPVTSAPPADASLAPPPAIAAASQTRLGGGEPPANGQHVPEWIRAAPPDGRADDDEPRFRLSRKLLMIGGLLVGLLALMMLAVLLVPALNYRLLPKPSTIASSPPLEPGPTVVAPSPTPLSVAAPNPAAVAGASATQAKPSAVPTRAPTSTVAPRSTVAPLTSARTSISPSAPPIIDIRFASGMPQNWLDNAPYAAWSAGAYRLQARQAARFVAVAAPLEEPLDDVMVSATFRKTGGPPGGGYGVIVRDQGPEPRDGINQTFNAYVFETGDLGEFGVWRREADRWVDLVPWTRSTAVRPGGSPNELVVRAVGDRLLFTVNSVELATLRDETWSGGRVGLFVGGDYNEVALDHFAIQVPD